METSQPVTRQKAERLNEGKLFTRFMCWWNCVSGWELVGMESSCCAECFSRAEPTDIACPHTTPQHSSFYIFSDPYFLLFYTRSVHWNGRCKGEKWKAAHETELGQLEARTFVESEREANIEQHRKYLERGWLDSKTNIFIFIISHWDYRKKAGHGMN